MKRYEFNSFGLDRLEMVEVDTPEPGPGQVRVDLRALSLNYRDLLVITGRYNPKLKLPAAPISDGAGIVSAVGEGVTRFKLGDAVISHFIANWIDGPFRGEYVGTTLGTPGPGLAAEQVVLDADALVPKPPTLDFAQAATLPIAALTAWSALVTEGPVEAGQTVLTLGTGGVSVFALQLAKALGCDVIITSSSDAKLARARELGADHTINYATTPDWPRAVQEITNGRGADLVLENAGAATINQSLAAVRPGGTIAMLGAVTGLLGEVNLAPVLMKRVRIAGIMVDSRAAFEDMLQFMEPRHIKPLIDARFPFDQLPKALQHMQSAAHVGKIAIDLPGAAK